MNINTTNINNITFQKAIRVQEGDHDSTYCSGDYGRIERNIAKVLNNENCDVYSKEEKKQIKEFFKPLFGEDNEDIVFCRYNEGKFFTSGQESKDIQKLHKFVKDARSIEIPKTEYRQSGGYDTSDGGMESTIASFQNSVINYAFPKINGLLYWAFRCDEAQTTIEIIPDNSNGIKDATKAKTIIATVETDAGETQTKLNFSA